MARMTIHLLCDPDTGRKAIVVGLRSEEDWLPHEHEQEHRRLVQRLIPGLAKAAEGGQVVLDREPELGPVALAGG